MPVYFFSLKLVMLCNIQLKNDVLSVVSVFINRENGVYYRHKVIQITESFNKPTYILDFLY